MNAGAITAHWPTNENALRLSRRQELFGKVPEEERQKSVARYKECLCKYAPELLEEYSLIAKELGWSLEDYLAYEQLSYAIPPSWNKSAHECTSAIFTPVMTATGDMMLQKNRDSSSRRLSMYRYPRRGKLLGWIGGGSQYSVTPCFGVNEKGLAIAMNSGDKSANCNFAGLSTTEITRVLLENCSTAQEAVQMYTRIVEDNAYCHGTSGSIFFFADAKEAYISENDAKYIFTQRIDDWELRANTWRFYRMAAHSIATIPMRILANHTREYEIFNCLAKCSNKFNDKISLDDIHRAFRLNVIPDMPKEYPPCGSATNSAVTFVIDHEFPTVLSTSYIAMGPPRKTVYLPFPIGLDTVPVEILNSDWSDKAFATSTDIDYEILEKAINASYAKAQDDARKLCRIGNHAAAQKLLNEAFRKIFNEAKKGYH